MLFILGAVRGADSHIADFFLILKKNKFKKILFRQENSSIWSKKNKCFLNIKKFL